MRRRKVQELFDGAYRIVDIEAEQSVRAAAKKMRDERVGALLIYAGEDRSKLAGIISERDLVQVLAEERDVDALNVGEVMTTQVVAVSLDDTIVKCRELMSHHRIRHLPVLGEQGQPIAMVSIRDVMGSELASQQREIEELESYIYEYR